MSTSKLQNLFGNMLYSKFPEYHIRENYRPEWMLSSDITRLELDFYIEELKLAFEVQGEQHFEYVEFFHGTVAGFEKRKRFDAEKLYLCVGKGIKLFEVCTETDAIVAIKNIQEIINQIPEPEENTTFKASAIENDLKTAERKRYSSFAKRRIKEHKPYDLSTFNFKYLDSGEQKELTGNMLSKWYFVSNLIS